jgi:hypothetical protein
MTGTTPGSDESAPADGLRGLDDLPLPDTRMLRLAIREGATCRPLDLFSQWKG